MHTQKTVTHKETHKDKELTMDNSCFSFFKDKAHTKTTTDDGSLIEGNALWWFTSPHAQTLAYVLVLTIIIIILLRTKRTSQVRARTNI
jgi:hypothetical protein